MDELRYEYALLPDVELRVIEEHEVDFSYREVMVGSRFHF